MNTPLNRIGDKGLTPIKPQDGARTQKQGKSFGSVLKKAVEEVNSLQIKADESIEMLATGEVTDVHEVMIAVNKANIAMELMLEIRNKIADAYQEIMRMPV